MSGRPHTTEEVRALSLTRGVCRECSEPWPKGANACGCGATGRDALMVAPVIGDLAETAEHLHAEGARINRLLVVQTSRGDGAEAAELRLTRERDHAIERAQAAEADRDAALAQCEELTRALSSALLKGLELRAIIEGRTTPPTDAERLAHLATGGSWRWRVNGTTTQTSDARRVRIAIEAHARHQSRVQWWAHDANDNPRAWPIAAEAPDGR